MRRFFVFPYSTDNTGAYSSFKRSRLKPLSAQNTSNTKEERASVFPEVTLSLMKTGFFTALSAFSRIGVFVQPQAQARVPLPRFKWESSLV